jgi:hypothetical protein
MKIPLGSLVWRQTAEGSKILNQALGIDGHTFPFLSRHHPRRQPSSQALEG